MIQDDFKEVLFKFVREACVEDVANIFVFGSVAKGTADNRSDIDLLVIFDTESEDIDRLEAKNRISELALSLEREYERALQIIFSNKRLNGLERYFIEKVFNEGILLYSKSPRIAIKGLEMESYGLFLYQVNNLDIKERLKVKRVLFGYKTSKKVKGRVYRTEKEGLVAEVGGCRLNSGTIVIPKKNTKRIEEALKEFRVKYKIVDIWLPDDSVIKIYD